MRDYTGAWDAVFAAAYVREHYEHHRRTSEHPVDDEDCDRIAEEAASIADAAIGAMHRLYPGPPP